MSQTIILQSKKPLLLCLCNSASSNMFHVMAEVAVLENQTRENGLCDTAVVNHEYDFAVTFCYVGFSMKMFTPKGDF